MNADLPSPVSCRRPPTARQVELLRLLATFIGEHGYPPTLREICTGLGISVWSTNGVSYQLRSLERKGLVKRTPMVSRGVVLTAAGKAFIEGGS